jgi:hypothetical protein
VSSLDLREASRARRPAIPENDGSLRSHAIATWRTRMINEYASSSVFEQLALQLERAGAPAARVRACAKFAEEERNHGILCGAVVEALGGDALATLPEKDPFPAHDDVEPLEGTLRNVLSVACLSETVAVALIGAEREEMPEGELKDLLTRIWSDEIGHARFGWKMVETEVPKLDAAARARLSAYLRIAFRHLESHELSHLPLTGEFGVGGAALGLCSGADARKLFYATVTTVIVPRLQSLGLHAERAWAERA